MLDAAKKALLAAGHGPARDLAPLEPDGKKRAAAVLLRSRHGLFVAASQGAEAPRVTAVHLPDMTYTRALLGDRLVLGGATYNVSIREQKTVRRMIARARLGPAPGPRLDSVLVQPVSPTERSVLGKVCAHDEPVLLLVRTDNTREVSSPITAPTSVRLLLVVTLRRTLLIGVSALGDYVVSEHLRALTRTQEGVILAGQRLDAKGERSLLVRAVRLEALSPADRVFAAFADNVRGGPDDATAAAGAAQLFAWLDKHDDWRAMVAAYFLAGHVEGAPRVDQAGLDAALRAGLDDEDGPLRLRRCFVGLGLDCDAGAQLLSRAMALAPARATLPLADALWAQRKDAPDEEEGHAAADASFAVHLAEAGEHERSLALVARRLARLPAHQIHEYVDDEDDPRALRTVRGELFRAQELSLRGLGRDVTATLAARCQNDPFDAPALARLVDSGPESLARRAGTVLALLAPGGLGGAAPSLRTSWDTVRALDPEDVDALRHPEATHRDMLVALQEFLAEEEKPDVRALRNFCQRLDPKKFPDLAAVVTDTMYALRLSKIDVFVSAGKKSLGVRAYRGKPRLLIVGERHLDAEDAHHLPVAELRFLVAGELAHLAFDHVRVTLDEVWRGAWDKGKTGLDLALTLLPAFKGAKLIDKARTILSVGNKAVRKVDKTTKQALRDETIGAENAALLEAHQLMQLSADRAGLLLCDDLLAAVRALFVGKPEELALADRFGLVEALRRRDEDGRWLDADRLMRAQALFAFYLDDRFDALRAALYRAPDEDDDDH